MRRNQYQKKHLYTEQMHIEPLHTAQLSETVIQRQVSIPTERRQLIQKFLKSVKKVPKKNVNKSSKNLYTESQKVNYKEIYEDGKKDSQKKSTYSSEDEDETFWTKFNTKKNRQLKPGVVDLNSNFVNPISSEKTNKKQQKNRKRWSVLNEKKTRISDAINKKKEIQQSDRHFFLRPKSQNSKTLQLKTQQICMISNIFQIKQSMNKTVHDHLQYRPNSKLLRSKTTPYPSVFL